MYVAEKNSKVGTWGLANPFFFIFGLFNLTRPLIDAMLTQYTDIDLKVGTY